MRQDVEAGGRLPDYELPDELNVKRRLSDLQGDDPMIVVILRGAF